MYTAAYQYKQRDSELRIRIRLEKHTNESHRRCCIHGCCVKVLQRANIVVRRVPCARRLEDNIRTKLSDFSGSSFLHPGHAAYRQQRDGDGGLQHVRYPCALGVMRVERKRERLAEEGRSQINRGISGYGQMCPLKAGLPGHNLKSITVDDK